MGNKNRLSVIKESSAEFAYFWFVKELLLQIERKLFPDLAQIFISDHEEKEECAGQVQCWCSNP